MKKSLFFLFALICSMSLFTACSDDDDTWEKLPNGEISADKIDLKLNGETTTGTVIFKATGAETAQVELKNVVDGYSDIALDVSMKEQADGSFAFSGTKDIATKPVVTRTETPFLTIQIDGTISKNGTVSMNLTATGLGLYIGTYTGETLALTYNGGVLVGKTVALDASTGDKASFQLQGVLPGEAAVTMTDVTYDGTKISGIMTTGLYSVEISGTHSNKVLTLDVKTTLNEKAQGGLAGTWNLNVVNPLYTQEFDMDTFETITIWSENLPASLNWTAIDKTKEMNTPKAASTVFSVLCSHLVAEVLNTVTFTADGGLTAGYYPKPNTNKFWNENKQDWEDTEFSTWMSSAMLSPVLKPYDRTWMEAPKGLVQWYVKDGYFYVVPNLAAIMGQIATDQGGAGSQIDIATIMAKLQELGITIDENMLAQVTGWLTNGIPLKYKVEGGILSLYVDKEMVAPFMNMLLPALPAIWEKVLASDTTGMASMLLGVLQLEKIEDLQTVWETDTEAFDITLCFKKPA